MGAFNALNAKSGFGRIFYSRARFCLSGALFASSLFILPVSRAARSCPFF